jgi:hypothetical protein
VDDLPLEVAEIDNVEVDDPDPPDAGGGEVHRGRRTKAARPDTQHAPGLQAALPLDADLRHDQVPAVALDFVVRKLRKRFNCCGHKTLEDF